MSGSPRRSAPLDLRERYGPFALVAGASEGLGAEFAEQLAAAGLDLILLARRQEVLAQTAAALAERHGVRVRPVTLDLGRPDLLQALLAAVQDAEVGLLVYNAALSPLGEFLALPAEQLLKAVDVNCRGPLLLAHTLGRAMAARGRGGIILMSSLAGAQGAPRIATYAATKAFNLVLAEGLWAELRRSGVDVLACRAGATRTPGYLRSGGAGKPGELAPGQVVAETLAALRRGPSLIPGRLNRLAAFVLGRLLPRRAAIAIMERSVRDLRA